jgi:hypothetical protein
MKKLNDYKLNLKEDWNRQKKYLRELKPMRRCDICEYRTNVYEDKKGLIKCPKCKKGDLIVFE